jgi:chemotaxis protein CheX
MMNQDAIETAIRQATEEVFSTMLAMEATAGQAYSEKKCPGPSDGLISVIGLAGSWVGTGSICCSGESACKISSAMMMSEYSEVSEDVLDAIAEVTNMIVGNFKTVAENHLGPLGLSVPTVIYGLNFTARSASRETWTVVPFRFGERGHMDVKICLTPNRGLSHLIPAGAATQRK